MDRKDDDNNSDANRPSLLNMEKIKWPEHSENQQKDDKSNNNSNIGSGAPLMESRPAASADGQILDKRAVNSSQGGRDGVPSQLISKMSQSQPKGFEMPNGQQQIISDKNSINGGQSVDAQTQVNQGAHMQSIYLSQKDMRSEYGFNQAADDPGRKPSSANNESGKQIMRIKGKHIQEEIMIKGAPGLPLPEGEALNNAEPTPGQGQQEDDALVGRNSQIFPSRLDAAPQRARCCKCCMCCRCCRRDIEADIEIHLDSCGKHSIVIVFLVMQLASIATFSMNYYLFYTRSCNNMVYKLTDPAKNIFNVNLGIELLLMINVVTSIVFKFASVVCLRIALDEYQELNSNCSYFTFALFFSLAPNCLLTPVYTYDHDRCQPKNIFFTQPQAEVISSISLVLAAIPIILLILIPRFLKKFYCCKRNNQKIISADNPEEVQEEVLKEQLDNRQSITAKLSNIMMFVIIFLVILIVIFFFFITCVVHIFQYRLFEGEILASGGNNEILSVVVLLLLLCMYRQQEITEEHIKAMMKRQMQDMFKSGIEQKMAKADERAEPGSIPRGTMKSIKDSDQPQNEDRKGSMAFDNNERADREQYETRAVREPEISRKDSLQSNGTFSVQSRYSGRFANGGAKIGFSAFNSAHVKEH